MLTELHVNYMFREARRVASSSLIIPQRHGYKYPGHERILPFARNNLVALGFLSSYFSSMGKCHPLRSRQEETRLKYNKPRRRYDTPRGSATSVNIDMDFEYFTGRS